MYSIARPLSVVHPRRSPSRSMRHRSSDVGEGEVRAARGAWRVFALGAEMGGFAAELLSFELGGEAVQGGFVLLAEFHSAFVENGLAGFFRFEEG
ncbi:MAG: hypothetical protein IT169_06845 [Bryobacterales bacterium]|nr:hypothetical protein [Bryobacterales bacterium]